MCDEATRFCPFRPRSHGERLKSHLRRVEGHKGHSESERLASLSVAFYELKHGGVYDFYNWGRGCVEKKNNHVQSPN